jgi:hypothetical protein
MQTAYTISLVKFGGMHLINLGLEIFQGGSTCVIYSRIIYLEGAIPMSEYGDWRLPKTLVPPAPDIKPPKKEKKQMTIEPKDLERMGQLIMQTINNLAENNEEDFTSLRERLENLDKKVEKLTESISVAVKTSKDLTLKRERDHEKINEADTMDDLDELMGVYYSPSERSSR